MDEAGEIDAAELDGLDRAGADAVVAEAARDYFAGVRQRIGPFIDANFTVAGSARLHRHALGWDLLKAPANVALSLPQVALRLGSVAARGLGAPETAEALAKRELFFETATGRELRWRLMTDLLQLPFEDGDRRSTRDALAEAILAHARIEALLRAAGAATARHRDDPVFRGRLEAALTSYAGTRAAAAEITTGLVTLGTGAVAFQKATPGALALGPVIAGSLAQGAAVSSFPLGTTAGGLWYGVFPAQASPVLVAGATAGVIGVAALATAFAGMVSDPVQRALGLHRRRLEALVNSLEQGFARADARGFRTFDLYAARLFDLSDVLIGIGRTFRPA